MAWTSATGTASRIRARATEQRMRGSLRSWARDMAWGRRNAGLEPSRMIGPDCTKTDAAYSTANCAAEVAPARLVCGPPRLALLEERGQPLARLGARAHFGQRARQRGAVLLPGRVGPQLEQHLD